MMDMTNNVEKIIIDFSKKIKEICKQEEFKNNNMIYNLSDSYTKEYEKIILTKNMMIYSGTLILQQILLFLQSLFN